MYFNSNPTFILAMIVAISSAGVSAGACGPNSGDTGNAVMLLNHAGNNIESLYCGTGGGTFTLHNAAIGCTVTGALTGGGDFVGCNRPCVPKGQANHACGSVVFTHCGGGDCLESFYNSPGNGDNKKRSDIIEPIKRERAIVFHA